MQSAAWGVVGVLLLILVVQWVAPASVEARPRESSLWESPVSPRPLGKTAADQPVYETRLHYVGQVWFAITTYGLIGTEGSNRVVQKDQDVLGISYSPSFEFPAGTRNEYLYAGGLWVGGIVGTDTLVDIPINGISASQDEWNGYDTISETSSQRTSQYYDPNAVAEQEFTATFYDTLILNSTDEVEGRAHKPIHLEVRQRSYAWSDRFSRQFVIMEYWIKNIGSRPVSKMTFGMFMDADVWNDNTQSGTEGSGDDISGWLGSAPSLADPNVRDSMNITWVADNDGDPVGGSYPLFSPRGVVGLRVLRAPAVEDLSFNWWLISATAAQEWGPVKAGARAPAGGGGLGAPEGDRNRYYVMTNGERDYGQLETAIDHSAQGYRPPLRGGACDVADGLDTRQLISVGPMVDPLLPGYSVPFVIAIMGGNNFHTDPNNTIDCQNPTKTFSTFSFDDLVFAGTWASWIYDTPGFDSDNDGYRGEYHLIECDSTVNGLSYGCDTVYYTGDIGAPPGPNAAPSVAAKTTAPTLTPELDSLPDFAGPAPPPCPSISIETRPTEIVVRWSGREPETSRDPLTRMPDFEEYRMYAARINTPDQYSLIASWDRDDYNIFEYDPEPPGSWVRVGEPVELSVLKQRYGQNFDPTLYPSPSTVNCFEDTVYDDVGNFLNTRCLYFTPQGFNQSNEYVDGTTGGIIRNIIQRKGDSTIVDDFGDTLTFGYYEAVLTNLNPALGQYISVTAWDFGNPKQRLDPSESGGGPGAAGCWDYGIPIYSADVVKDSALKVSVFPNPYKIHFEGPDGHQTSYFDQGFEAPEKFGSGQGIAEQDRRIWFINLPDTATIKIYTLDGDLVRTLDHVYVKGSTELGEQSYSSRAAWDLVTRNAQAAVSGIYIYRVDSKYGSQLGKLVIIK